MAGVAGMFVVELREPVQASKACQNVPPPHLEGLRIHTVSRSSPSISASFRPLSTRNLRFAATSSRATCEEVRNVLARCRSSDLSSGTRTGRDSETDSLPTLLLCGVAISGGGGGGACAASDMVVGRKGGQCGEALVKQVNTR